MGSIFTDYHQEKPCFASTFVMTTSGFFFFFLFFFFSIFRLISEFMHLGKWVSKY